MKIKKKTTASLIKKLKQGWLVASPKTFPKEDPPDYEAKRAILQLDTKQSESQFKDEDGERGV